MRRIKLQQALHILIGIIGYFCDYSLLAKAVKGSIVVTCRYILLIFTLSGLEELLQG